MLILTLVCCVLCLCIYEIYIWLNSGWHTTGYGTYGHRIWSHSLLLMSSCLWKRCRGITTINQDNWGYQEGLFEVLSGYWTEWSITLGWGPRQAWQKHLHSVLGSKRQAKKSSIWKKKGCCVKDHKVPKCFLHSECPSSCRVLNMSLLGFSPSFQNSSASPLVWISKADMFM